MKKRLAIIGTGISGLGCAYFLQHHYDLTLFEKNSHIGGHSNTVNTDEEGRSIAVDTGFMVYNKVTYPNLVRLFAELGITENATDMSFSLQHLPEKLEWSGASFKRLFCQKKNYLNTRFWRMLGQLARFNREALMAIESSAYDNDTLAEYVKKRNYGEDLLRWYLIPMSAAIWSTPPEPMLDFPAVTLIRFFHNHGFLGQDTQHQWYTVQGGSRSYVEKLTAPFRDRIRLNTPVRQVVRQTSLTGEAQVEVTLEDGSANRFDRVIMASHADETLRMLTQPNTDEVRLLSAFQYQLNLATLHTDESVMPGCKPCWASWNYRIDQTDGKELPSTHYWMNCLQQLNAKQNYFVSINGGHRIRPDRILKQIPYHHPIFSREAVSAQSALPQLNQRDGQNVYFCGSYFKYGFHEDAFTSALELCRTLLGEDLWR